MVAPARATSRQGKWHTLSRTISYIDDNKGEEYLAKPLLPGQNRLWLPPALSARDGRCPNHPDLYLLRTPGRGAIDYLACAAETCWMRFSWMLPKMRWSTMRKRCGLFPGLIRPGRNARRRSSRRAGNETADRQAEMGYRQKPRKRRMSRSPNPDLPAVQYITKAIQDELHAINKYQRYMNAENPALRAFCHLMNEEKEHVAEFTAALFRLTHEPLPEETD